MIPQHLSASFEHFTPLAVVVAARLVLDAIDLDPASCAEAQEKIRARRWIGLPKDGLSLPWKGNVFLNPPGGTFIARRKNAEDPKPVTPPEDLAHKLKWKTNSRAVAWWRKLVMEHEGGHVPHAVFVGFNLDILQATQDPGRRDPLHFSICVPRDRLHFGGDQPTHGNVIVYLGRRRRRFEEIFGAFGTVKL